MADGHDPERTRRVASKARKAIMGHVQYIPHDYHDESATAGQSMSRGEGSTSEGKAKELHMDLPARAQLDQADAHHEAGGSDALGGGPQSHMDEGSAGAHGKDLDPEHMLAKGDGPHEQMHNDPGSADDHAGEAGEEGASRSKDLLGPGMQHGMVHSATVKKLLGAYKRSK